MGWYKSLDTAKSEPVQPATPDMQQDGLFVFLLVQQMQAHGAANTY